MNGDIVRRYNQAHQECYGDLCKELKRTVGEHWEDAAQEVMEKFWKVLLKGDVLIEQDRAYIFGIARREPAHYYEAKSRERAMQQKQFVDGERAAQVNIAQKDHIYALGQLKDSMDGFSARDQRWLYLFSLKGMTQEEIARLDGVHQTTVGRVIKRWKQSLRE